MTAADPRAAALAYLDALNGHDPDAIAACVTESFVNEHTTALAESVVGRDAYRQRLPVFLAEFRGLRYDVEEVVAEGDRVVVAYRLSASWEGRPFSLRGVFRFRVEDGLVAARVDYWDSGEFRRQVGE